jgi:sortase A
VLRIAGRVLIGAAVVVAGFLAYQLWVTSFFAYRAQAGLASELDVRVSEVAPVRVVYEPADLPASPFVPPVDAGGPGTAPATVDAPAAVDAEPMPNPDGSTVTGGGDGAGSTLLVTEPPPERGAAMARLVIPAVGVDWTIVEGVGRAELRSGAGHMPGTALPGQPGNAVISGHRTTYGAPFGNLDGIEPGDLITVTTVTGTHTYEAVEMLVVGPTDIWVTEQWDGGWLTLTTCHPRFSASQRLVVVARLVAGPNADILRAS